MKSKTCRDFLLSFLIYYRQNARDLYRSQLEKNEIELSAKNKELIEKIYQIDLLKVKYEEAIANVDPITTTVIKFCT